MICLQAVLLEYKYLGLRPRHRGRKKNKKYANYKQLTNRGMLGNHRI